jgi:two-component system response regulator GlrR
MDAISNTRSAKVLVVDDDASVLEIITDMLNYKGYTVFPFRSGAEAVKSMEAEKPDIIITDFYMPNLDGLELAEQIKEEYPNIPIVLLTGSFAPQSEIDPFYRNVDLVLTKPVGWQQLLEAVSKLLAMNLTQAE